MSRITIIEQNIDINVRHINEFKLDTNDGTKKMKEKYHKNAVIQRNNYVLKQQEKFEIYKKQVYMEMKKRVDQYYPTNQSDKYKAEEDCLSTLKEMIRFSNPYLDSSYKLGLLDIIRSIKEEGSSLDEINATLKLLFDKFKEMDIKLTINDFSYSMFTQEYMGKFLKHIDNLEDLRDEFVSIYWECPDFVKHLKLNLWYILDKYKKQIDIYCDKFKDSLFSKYGLDENNLISFYYEKLDKYYSEIDSDEYLNLTSFLEKKRNINDYLEGSVLRKSNLNSLTVTGDFSSLNEVEVSKYYAEVEDLVKDLSSLKKYYRYQFIAKDLQDKYSKISELKDSYDNKLKEIAKEEGLRSKIYNNYLRACGIGFLARRDEKKISSCKLDMNQEILKLYNLYSELHDLEIIDKMSKELSNISSLYDLFLAGYSSFYYLEKMFSEHFKDVENFSSKDEFNSYFDFIYSFQNSFLSKVNAFVPYDITSIVSEKYLLLGLNVLPDGIVEDNIDKTISVVSFIKLIRNIEEGSLPLEIMNFIVQFMEFEKVSLEDFEEHGEIL